MDIFASLKNSWQLFRFDRPVGTGLLLWPTLSALWLAQSGGRPPIMILIVFAVGAILMRAAGSALNDIMDRSWDAQVRRTATRPLAQGRLPVWQAWLWAAVACLLALSLFYFLNTTTRLLAILAMMMVLVYPLTKRFWCLPQLVLGVTWSMGILMAFTQLRQRLPLIAWLFFGFHIAWTVAYDTFYAMADWQDDRRLGIYSSAIWSHPYEQQFTGFFQLLSLVCLIGLGFNETLLRQSHFYWISIFCFCLALYWQQRQIRDRDPAKCLRAFRISQWVGLILFIGIAISLGFDVR